MKQSEKLDLVLKSLYEKKFDGKYYDLPEILLGHGIEVNFTEGFALGKRLESDGFVKAHGTKSGMAVTLTTIGVDYIENDSYTYRGQSVISNHYSISINGSTNTSVVQNSTNTSIYQNNNDNNNVDDLINNILKHLQTESLESQKFEDIKACLNEIKISLDNNLTPKFSFKSLLTMTSEFSSVSSLIVSLGQLIGQ